MKRKVMPKPSTLTRISIVSTLYIFAAMLLASLVFPVILDALGLKLYLLRVLVFGLATGFSVSYSLFVRDSNRGFTKGFWITFLLFTLLACGISYFWVFNIYPV